jgi:hypothetical protein
MKTSFKKKRINIREDHALTDKKLTLAITSITLTHAIFSITLNSLI